MFVSCINVRESILLCCKFAVKSCNFFSTGAGQIFRQQLFSNLIPAYPGFWGLHKPGNSLDFQAVSFLQEPAQRICRFLQEDLQQISCQDYVFSPFPGFFHGTG